MTTSTEINVLILGEIGTGKSTLIHYLTNLFHNGSLRNLKASIPSCYLSPTIDEDHQNIFDDLTKSQTRQLTKYQFRVEQVLFQFFDTPGYSSDETPIDAILQCLQSVNSLSAIILVFNGSLARVTINIRTILERFRSEIPDFISSNLIVVLSNSSKHTVNFDAKQILPDIPVFLMQNSAFVTDHRTWSDQTRQLLQTDWNRSIETLNEILEAILLFSPIATKSLFKMQEDRNQLRSLFHECRLILNKFEQTSQEHPRTKLIQVNEISLTPFYNTLCFQCNMVCHEQCLLTETTQIGQFVIRRCTVMDNGQCTKCPGRCSYQMHYHDRHRIQSVERTIKCANVNDDETLENQLNKIEKISHRVQKNFQHINLAQEFISFIDLIETDLKRFRSPMAIERANDFLQQLKQLANAQHRTPMKKDRHKSSIQITSIDRNYEEYSTEQLIRLINQSMERVRLMEAELKRRCQGISSGYLSPNELVTLCEYYTNYRRLSTDQLRQLYEDLQRSTNSTTCPMPSEEILQLIALRFCLDNESLMD